MSELPQTGPDVDNPRDEVPPYPEPFSSLSGELRVRAESAWREANGLVRCLGKLHSYYLSALPGVVVTGGGASIDKGRWDLTIEVPLRNDVELHLDALKYLEINSKIFLEKSFEELCEMVPDLPPSQVAAWLGEITEQLPAVREAGGLDVGEPGSPGTEDPYRIRTIQPRGVVEFRERLAPMMNELCNEVRSFLFRLGLDPYQALARSGPPLPPGLTLCQKDCVLVIQKAGRRLTTKEVLSALNHLAALNPGSKLHGESTVKLALKDLCRPPLDLLDNRSDVRPRGYGLKSWGR
jgi:hypothetical protein